MHLRNFVLPAMVASFALGCGYSEEEWQAQLDKYNRLQGEHQNTEARLAKTQADLKAEQTRVSELTKKLEAAGFDITKLNENLQNTASQVSQLSASLEERERALAEYKARAKQLEQIKARFDTLRKKLDELTKLGLAVNIRRNRMVVSLPGDVLFDSGRETLKKEGKEILEKVATVIRADASLVQRDFQVAGHTDNKPLAGGIFRDNWGLSLMRAREVLLYLVSDKGKLPIVHWSASGYGDTDPVANNDSDDGRQKNRRCDIIVVPSVEEMLDLKAIAQ
ncbi:OmpA/MotB family protein [Chondromyces apiculatus]|uniref:Flagellar motor rotation protein MotB n=1 Tax=Chondromyces apiculatus DSM 436 TaxID=1192034 RepID=A0A017THW0_9BACT|nr:OmpA family protein [Chondromyces apiculatus]EYF08868.1 Flagellar motor rotation protein MotB [Chondromyces apiculatus DSM 436]